MEQLNLFRAPASASTDMPRNCEDRRGLLEARVNYPLEVKIDYAMQRVVEWYDHWKGQVYISFSGGKDSTVLRHLIYSMGEPYTEIPSVFVNTGLEYPEIVQFVKSCTPEVEIIRPKMSYVQVLRHHGFPVVSKRIAQYIREVRNARGETATKKLRMTGMNKDGKHCPARMISKKWQYLLDAPFKISDRCCNVMKKDPAKDYNKRTGRVPYLGIMVTEGRQRELTYLEHGCNAYSLSSQPRSWPIAIWKEADVWEYIKTRNVPYSSIYDMGVDRTGCVWCAFGAHLDGAENRFQRLKNSHPQLWKYCMDKLGMREVLQFVGIQVD